MAPVDEDGELDAVRPPEVEERVDCGADRPSREEDVVDEHARPALEREVELRPADDGMRVARLGAATDHDVVAMERDVHGSDHRLDVAPLGDERAQPSRQRHAAGVDADERELGEVVGALDQLVREPRERPRQGICVEDLARLSGVLGSGSGCPATREALARLDPPLAARSKP